MALDKNSLIDDIYSALNKSEEESKVENATPEDVKKNHAQYLADAIEKYIKSGEVEAGIKVSVTPQTGNGSTIERGKIV